MTNPLPPSAQSKQMAKTGLSTPPRLTKARCLLEKKKKKKPSLFLTTHHSPLLSPPHSLSCLRLCSSHDLAVFFQLSARLSLPCKFLSLSLSKRRLVKQARARSSPSTALAAAQGEKLDPHVSGSQRSVPRRITSSRRACQFDPMAVLKATQRPVCLSKSFKRLPVYFSTSRVPLDTALWSQQSRSCWHTVLSIGAGAKHRANTNLLFHLSAERKHPILKMLCRQSSFLLTAFWGGNLQGPSFYCCCLQPAISLNLFNLRSK